MFKGNLKSDALENCFWAVLAKFLAKFKDGHVSINFALNSDAISMRKIPILVMPVEGKAIVVYVEQSLSDLFGIAYGDEIVSIDGEDLMTGLLPKIKQYASLGNELTDEHLVYHSFYRPSYMTALLPTETTAKVVIKKASGESDTRSIHWREEPYYKPAAALTSAEVPALRSLMGGFKVNKADEINAAAKGSLMEHGAAQPFFFNAGTKAAYDMEIVRPSEDSLAKYGLTLAQAPEIFAALYKYQGKTILLVRQPTYGASDFAIRLQAYKAILDQYDQFADVLVLDQSHNPGGFLDYAEGFFSLFLNERKNGLVNKLNADRKWIDMFRQIANSTEVVANAELKAIFSERADKVESSYDSGKELTDYMPISGDVTVEPDQDYTWKKPILVIADELSGSCGDIFPMLMQRNRVAKIFGERTMGLGGNVEEVPELTYSRAKVRLTRGLFNTYRPDGSYTQEELIENNGVIPDIHHAHTIDDVRAGFAGYVKAFSQAAVEQIPAN